MASPTYDEWYKTKYGGYFINKKGEVKKVFKKTEKMVNYCLGKNGYYYFSAGSKAGKVNIHRLLAEMFLDNPHNKRNVDHINRIKSDNRLENLRWYSQSENMLNTDIIANNLSNIVFKNNCWLCKVGSKVIGRFDTENEARACKYGYLKALEISTKYSTKVDSSPVSL